jgi:AmiR/NasT family two-component response regulator
MNPGSFASLIVFDDGRAAGLDGLAVAVAMFGNGRFQMVYVADPMAVRGAADHVSAGSVVVVNVDNDPDPKQTLADLTDAGLPVVVLTAGGDETVTEHARSVGAAACLPMSLPARELVSRLAVAGP